MHSHGFWPGYQICTQLHWAPTTITQGEIVGNYSIACTYLFRFFGQFEYDISIRYPELACMDPFKVEAPMIDDLRDFASDLEKYKVV